MGDERAHTICIAHARPASPRPPPNTQKKQPTVRVVRPAGAPTVATPRQGDIVTVRVLRTSARAAGVEILCIEGGGEGTSTTTTTPLPDPGPPGVIRAADVRATAVDAVDVGACFRPGDLVRAAVSSVGDARAFYLSTAEPGLGVVSARSASHPARPRLEPASDQGMRCPLSGAIESRKVAVKQA